MCGPSIFSFLLYLQTDKQKTLWHRNAFSEYNTITFGIIHYKITNIFYKVSTNLSNQCV